MGALWGHRSTLLDEEHMGTRARIVCVWGPQGDLVRGHLGLGTQWGPSTAGDRPCGQPLLGTHLALSPGSPPFKDPEGPGPRPPRSVLWIRTAGGWGSHGDPVQGHPDLRPPWGPGQPPPPQLPPKVWGHDLAAPRCYLPQ